MARGQTWDRKLGAALKLRKLGQKSHHDVAARAVIRCPCRPALDRPSTSDCSGCASSSRPVLVPSLPDRPSIEISKPAKLV